MHYLIKSKTYNEFVSKMSESGYFSYSKEVCQAYEFGGNSCPVVMAERMPRIFELIPLNY